MCDHLSLISLCGKKKEEEISVFAGKPEKKRGRIGGARVPEVREVLNLIN